MRSEARLLVYAAVLYGICLIAGWGFGHMVLLAGASLMLASVFGSFNPSPNPVVELLAGALLLAILVASPFFLLTAVLAVGHLFKLAAASPPLRVLAAVGLLAAAYDTGRRLSEALRGSGNRWVEVLRALAPCAGAALLMIGGFYGGEFSKNGELAVFALYTLAGYAVVRACRRMLDFAIRWGGEVRRRVSRARDALLYGEPPAPEPPGMTPSPSPQPEPARPSVRPWWEDRPWWQIRRRIILD